MGVGRLVVVLGLTGVAHAACGGDDESTAHHDAGGGSSGTAGSESGGVGGVAASGGIAGAGQGGKDASEDSVSESESGIEASDTGEEASEDGGAEASDNLCNGIKKCSSDSYDVDKNPANGCEYVCFWNSQCTVTLDIGGEFKCGIDDDCDGKVDEDVDLCSDDNCGKCGKLCTKYPHATAKCTKVNDAAACTPANSACVIVACDPGWSDENGGVDDGCETPAG